MKRYMAVLLAMLLLAGACVSCGRGGEEVLPEGAVPVLSCYPHLSYLLPGDYDTARYEDSTYARRGYATYVAEVDGQLAILPSHAEGSSTAPRLTRDTVYGFDGLRGGSDGIFLDGTLLVGEACVGMVHSYFGDRLLAVTTTEQGGTVRFFERTGEGETWRLSERTLEVDGEIRLLYYRFPSMNHDAPGTLYLITSEGVILLKTDGYLNRAQGDPASVEAEVLAVPDWWQYVRPTGAAETADGTVFVGEREGVIGIAPDGTLTYYPLDYAEAIYGTAAGQ